MRAALTAGIWIVSLASVTLAGLIAAIFVVIATSLDPTQILTAGAEPWTDALWATLAFVGVAVAAALGLALWHGTRFKIVGVVLTLAEASYVAWACAKVYNDYF